MTVICNWGECQFNREGLCSTDIEIKVFDDGSFFGPVCRTGLREDPPTLSTELPVWKPDVVTNLLLPVVWYVDGSGKGRVVCVNAARTKIIDNYTRATTNNEAEWEAVLAALGYVGEGAIVEIRADSLDVVNWINGTYKTRDDRMRAYKERVLFMIKMKKLQVTFMHVPREENLAGQFMEGKLKL